MSNDASWTDYFHLPMTAIECAATPSSLRDRLFPRCATCGEVCAEIWA